MLTGSPQRPPRKTRPGPSSLVIRNVVVNGHRTSVRLEPVMWDALNEIARQQKMHVNALVTSIDAERDASSLTAASRVYIVAFYRALALRAGWNAREEKDPARPRVI
jgi:predicted DNA-binding ribbon-helix-helix protein